MSGGCHVLLTLESPRYSPKYTHVLVPRLILSRIGEIIVSRFLRHSFQQCWAVVFTLTQDIVVEKMYKIGRNEPCPCGSGRKHKHCCSQDSVRNEKILRAASQATSREELVALLNRPIHIYRLQITLESIRSQEPSDTVSRTIEIEDELKKLDYIGAMIGEDTIIKKETYPFFTPFKLINENKR